MLWIFLGVQGAATVVLFYLIATGKTTPRWPKWM